MDKINMMLFSFAFQYEGLIQYKKSKNQMKNSLTF